MILPMVYDLYVDEQSGAAYMGRGRYKRRVR